MHQVGNKPPIIKPDDIVRTPTGRLARCTALNPDGSRELEDLATGERFDLRVDKLYLVQSATPRVWPSRRPA